MASLKQFMILDCDPGVDDAHAIMMAVSRPDVQVLAITIVQGNCPVDKGCMNALRVLRVCKHMNIPVFRGSCTPLMGEDYVQIKHPTCFHGSDGMGDVPESNPPDIALIQEEHAVQAIIRIAKQTHGNLTLVAIGPLTNVAMAVRLFPRLGSYLKQTVIMGGNIEGKGNCTQAAEFNFASDPEAAHIVLNSLHGQIKLVSWETSGLNDDHCFAWEWFEKWLRTNTVIGEFNKSITLKNGKFKRDVLQRSKYNSCDAVAMAVALDDAVIKNMVPVGCDVELSGRLTRGQMVVDWSNIDHDRGPNVHIITAVDINLVMRMLEQAVGS